MTTETGQEWITGQEFNGERLRLIAAGVPDEAPEFQALIRRVRERDDSLFEQYGKPYLESDYGKWIAISLDGRILLREHGGQAGRDARASFGGGNYCVRRLTENPEDVLHGARSSF